MFSNPGKILKILAIIYIIIITIASAILGLGIADGEFWGILVFVPIGFIIGYFSALIILTFANIAENVAYIKENFNFTNNFINNNSASSAKTVSLADIKPISTRSEFENKKTWKCSRCGRVNSTQICSCGKPRGYAD